MNSKEYDAAQQAQKLYGVCIQHIMDNKEADFRLTLEEYFAKHNYVKVQEALSGFQSGGKTFLHVACSCARSEIVDYLLTLSPAPRELINLADENGFTPLMNATCGESIGIMRVLLEYGASVNAVNKDGAAAVHFACGDGSLERLQLLAQHGADLNLSSKAGAPLHWAAGKGHSSVVAFLASAPGVDVNKKSGDGLPAIIMAAATSKDDIVCTLIDAGADTSVSLPGNTNLFHICAEHGLKQAVLKMLNSSPPSITHARTSDDNLAIHLAAMSHHQDLVSLILDKDEAFHASQMNNFTGSRDEMVQWFMKEGAIRLEKWKAAHKQRQQQSVSSAPVAPPSPVFDVSSLAEATPEQIELSEQHKAAGNTHFKNKEYSDALVEYSKAVALYPRNHVLYSNRSACYLAAQDLTNALHDAEMCRHLAPAWSKGCYRLAAARFALEMYEDAAVAAYEGCQLDDSSHELKSLMKLAIKKGREEHQRKVAAGAI